MSIYDRIKREPTVLIGALASVVLAVYEVAAAGGATWQSLVPVAVGAFARFFTVPASEVVDVEGPDELLELLGVMADTKETPDGP
jgi:hypothetical protein